MLAKGKTNMYTPFKTETSKEQNITVLKLSGRMLESEGAIKKARITILEALVNTIDKSQDEMPLILLDLSGLTHIDGASIIALFHATKQVEASGGRMAVLGAEGDVKTRMDRERLATIALHSYTDKKQAVDYLLNPQQARLAATSSEQAQRR
jgi:anti-anti-sigma factor